MLWEVFMEEFVVEEGVYFMVVEVLVIVFVYIIVVMVDEVDKLSFM